MNRHAPSIPARRTCLAEALRLGRVRKRYVALLIILMLVGWVGWKVLAIMSARPGPLVDYTRQLIELSER